MKEVATMEVNEMLSPQMVREEELRDEDTLSDISEIGSQNLEEMYCTH